MKALAAAMMLAVVGMASAVVWFAIMGNPLGGEPAAVVVIDPESRPAAALESIAPKPTSKGGKTQASLRDDRRAARAPETDTGARDGEFRPPPDVAVVGLNTSDGPLGEPRQVPAAPLERAVAGDGGSVVMPPVPIDAIMENSRHGALPRIAEDGRRASQLYARPIRIAALPQAGEPARIAILVNGLGLSDEDTGRAIEKLPGAISLALSPYGSNLQNWVRKARAHGHEVLLQLPLEPFDYPDNDPGPHTLLTNLTAAENIKRLHWVMSRFTGYVGVTNHMGTKFQSHGGSLSPVLAELKKRGLIYVDDGTAPRSVAGVTARDIGLGSAAAQISIDGELGRDGIERALGKLESLAKENGLAIAVATNLPVTVRMLGEWAETLKDKGLVLIPMSAAVLAQRQS